MPELTLVKTLNSFDTLASYPKDESPKEIFLFGLAYNKWFYH